MKRPEHTVANCTTPWILRLLRDAAPIPPRSNRKKILQLKVRVAEAEADLRAAEKKCAHPLADRVHTNYVHFDTLGCSRGGGDIVTCALCGKILYKEES